MNTSRILSLTGTPHPFAEVQSLDPSTGLLVFRWLDAQRQPVDSGGSIARFTPPAPLPEDPEQPGVVNYPEITNEALAGVIVTLVTNPVPLPVPSRRQRTDIMLQRLTEAERAALFTARKTVWQVDYLITRAAATGEIHEDDADFPLGRATLDQLGIIATTRWDALFAP